MYVECVGVPGAGKTTIVERTAEMLNARGIRCTTKTSFFKLEQKRGYKILWSLCHMHYLDLPVAVLLFRLARRRGSSLENMLTKLHEHQKLRYQFKHQRQGEVAMWDGWFVQVFSALISSGFKSEESVVEFIQKRLPHKTLLVYVDTPARDAVERMWERERRLRAIAGVAVEKNVVDKEKQQQEFMNEQQTQKGMIETLARRGVRIIRLDGTRHPTENATIIYEEVVKYFSV
ncbi:MAG: hypothetical protein UU67_C0035G0002 [Candidatus Daviesbacteria bacterium GW2011_GWB1_41_5]|uniref:Thymidylate kinase-like domain-containing protein n=1 Tax=Candidatus Daviesbacteria bacterium GW2011_GWB1_41_5 TaxID=1618429 RepID=A0A0G0WJC6_9BACT|nr:MAG: hypothetical protein UU67_C0035G0002 [Candidatus Daviesbacteria bacterium GW2011_GWB1_41_5]